jgi:hypothetical protein
MIIPRIFAPGPVSCSALGTATFNDGSFAAFERDEGMRKRRRLRGFHVGREVGMVRKSRELLRLQKG